ncbi:MAG: Rne/Rng family ribonuclease [Proteobacteria bacterium]|nr:Rne/Rng family ribonuclease [Pseudomonadota bacterium]
MKRMLINATQHEELRVAMVDGQQLYDLNIELPASERKKANIYKGQITRIEPSLEAAFVNYGADRHGFLPLKEISSEYFVTTTEPGKKVNIKDVLREGQDIVVQIDKEERGNKGAALTTFVSLAGRFIVLKPNKQKSGGVSRRIIGEDRDLARQSMRDVEVPDGMSVILRTAGIDRSEEELSWDVENLLAVWEAIKKVVVEHSAPFLIYRESDSVVRALRDYLTNEIGEILIDDEATYKEAREFVEQVMPQNLRKLKLYEDSVPLFTRYQIESQIESAFSHSVDLPSGGSVVIDHTEALVSIDVNSARATKGGDIEATALNTNLEAADEIARQLRLRDLGGLVVIDFIDMGPQRNQRDVENRLRDAVRQDRARVQLGKISRFGLLEMSRQRMRPSLGESSNLVCPRCSGIGNIRSVESLALAILRIIGEEARKERTAKVIAQLPAEVATYLLNEKRDWVQSLETRHNTQVILVANPLLETPHYQVRRVRDDQVDLPENIGISFTLVDTQDEPEIPKAMQDKKPAEIAAVTTMVATTPAPQRKAPPKKTGPGLFSRIASFFSSSEDSDDKARKPSQRQNRKSADGNQRGGQRVKKRGEAPRQTGSQPTGGKSQQRTGQQGKKKRGKKTGDKDVDRTGQQANRRNDAQVSEKQEQADETRQEAQGENRPAASKRRSRGGRRRRRNADVVENADNLATADQNTEQPSAENSAEKRPERKPRRARASNGAAASTAPTPNDAKSGESIERSEKSAENGHGTESVRGNDDSGPRQDQSDPERNIAANTQTMVPAAKLEQPPGRESEPGNTATRAATPDSRESARLPGYEDTQPELPVLSSISGRDQEKPVSKPVVQQASSPVPEKSEPAKSVESGNGESQASVRHELVAETPIPTAGEKPAARLLPWEPAADSTQAADKD